MLHRGAAQVVPSTHRLKVLPAQHHLGGHSYLLSLVMEEVWVVQVAQEAQVRLPGQDMAWYQVWS